MSDWHTFAYTELGISLAFGCRSTLFAWEPPLSGTNTSDAYRDEYTCRKCSKLQVFGAWHHLSRTRGRAASFMEHCMSIPGLATPSKYCYEHPYGNRRRCLGCKSHPREPGAGLRYRFLQSKFQHCTTWRWWHCRYHHRGDCVRFHRSGAWPLAKCRPSRCRHLGMLLSKALNLCIGQFETSPSAAIKRVWASDRLNSRATFACFSFRLALPFFLCSFLMFTLFGFSPKLGSRTSKLLQADAVLKSFKCKQALSKKTKPYQQHWGARFHFLLPDLMNKVCYTSCTSVRYMTSPPQVLLALMLQKWWNRKKWWNKVSQFFLRNMEVLPKTQNVWWESFCSAPWASLNRWLWSSVLAPVLPPLLLCFGGNFFAWCWWLLFPLPLDGSSTWSGRSTLCRASVLSFRSTPSSTRCLTCWKGIKTKCWDNMKMGKKRTEKVTQLLKTLTQHAMMSIQWFLEMLAASALRYLIDLTLRL